MAKTMHSCISAMAFEERCDQRDEGDEQKPQRTTTSSHPEEEREDQERSEELNEERPTKPDLGYEGTKCREIETATEDLLQRRNELDTAEDQPEERDFGDRLSPFGEGLSFDIWQQEGEREKMTGHNQASEER